jgi:hypothetical protein
MSEIELEARVKVRLAKLVLAGKMDRSAELGATREIDALRSNDDALNYLMRLDASTDEEIVELLTNN